MRNWLSKHGKHQYIDFSDKERRQYQEIFDALDNDGSKAITIKELEDPLIALGIVSTRGQVEAMIKEIDENGDGDIEFNEFLLVMSSIRKADKKNEKNNGSSSLYDFFKDMIEGNFNKRGDMDNDVPFMLNFSMFRRRRIMDAIISQDVAKKKVGHEIMNVSPTNKELQDAAADEQDGREGGEGRGPHQCLHWRQLRQRSHQPKNWLPPICSVERGQQEETSLRRQL